MSEQQSMDDQAFHAWEMRNYQWHRRTIDTHTHDTLMFLLSTSHGVYAIAHSMREQLSEALKMDSPLVLTRLADASFDCNLVFVPEIAEMVMGGDENSHPRLFTALDNILPRLKDQIDTMTSKEGGEVTWSSDQHVKYIHEMVMGHRSLHDENTSDERKQAANGLAILLHKHGFDTGESPNFPFPDVPAWLPENLKQFGIAQAATATNG